MVQGEYLNRNLKMVSSFLLSKKCTSSERNDAVVEKEYFAIVLAFKSLKVYLEAKPFQIESDHTPLQ